jgi:hypothetical protein
MRDPFAYKMACVKGRSVTPRQGKPVHVPGNGFLIELKSANELAPVPGPAAQYSFCAGGALTTTLAIIYVDR